MASSVVTVFGGTGYLGRAVVRRLAAEGYVVRVAARQPWARPLPAPQERLQHRRADIRDPDDVAAALEEAYGAVNAVSLYAEHRGATFGDIHVDAAAGLAKAAAAAGLQRLVHISGIGADPQASSGYISARGRGATRLQPFHVADVAAAVDAALTDPGAAGRIFELGGAEVYRYREIVAMVMARRGRFRPMLTLPFPIWHRIAAAASPLPSPPLTHNQVALMAMDNVVTSGRDSLIDLGIRPRALRTELADCLPGGYADRKGKR